VYFKDFREIIKLLKGCVAVQDKCSEVLQPQVFEDHNLLITALLKQIYNDYAVNYILNEWLCGNKSPIIFTNNEGVTIQIPMRTVQELWKAMETYGRHELDKEQE